MKNDPSEITYDACFSKTTREWFLSSALYDGIEDEDLRQIETLLAVKGANPNILLAEYGISPFHLAVANENTVFAIQATDICLQHGADPNVRSEDGLTPVHLTSMWGCQEILHLLLASGGDPWLVDSFRMNAFQYALKYKQQACYDILETFAKSQPQLPTHPLSPHHLNLKRVILYKNDLQIVYESSQSSSHRCVSTQTSRGQLRLSAVEEFNKKDTKNIWTCTKLDNGNWKNAVENKECHIKTVSDLDNLNKVDEKSNAIPNKHNVLDFTNHISINNRLKDIIVKHRRNSLIFQYPTVGEEVDNSSCRNTNDNHEESSGTCELFEKLDRTNKLRQSLKISEEQRDIMKNITQRKKLFHSSEKPLCALVEESLSNNFSDQCTEIHDEIKSKQNISTDSHEFVSTQNDSSTSIGLILDNLDSTHSQTRGSSLFSDIASDVEVCAIVEQENRQNIDDIMTEDETSLKETHRSKDSSTDSLYPYVSCDNVSTRESETNECFESCLEKFPTGVERNDCSVHSEIHSLVDFILNNIHDSGKITPVNPKLVTSTPERNSCGSDSSPISTVDQKKKWVEAHLSSSEEEQYLSISEEYEYTDLDEGVVLIEKRYLNDNIRISTNKKEQTKSGVGSSTSEESEVSTISGSDGAYDTDDLRNALQERGYPVGPITGNTKRVYLRQLKRLRHRPDLPPAPNQPAYSAELVRTLQSPCEHLLYRWAHLEDSMAASFMCERRPWRQGQAKTSFTYLLLNPTLLPPHRRQSPFCAFWPHFLQAVFYVGKGKRARPYAHLYEAVAAWKENRTNNSAKIQQILDIWNSGQGVVCLHVFQNIIPVEALTREAAMISALTLQHLKNEKAGEFYASAACWNMRLKRQLGCVLLHRACQVFLAEGERQLRPADID